MRRRAAAALLATAFAGAIVASAVDAAAQPSRPGAAFGSEAGEIGLALACGATLTARLLPQQESEWGPSHTGEFAFDTGLVSDFIGAGIGSALQIGAGYGFETAYLASHGDREPAVGALRTMVIDVESLMLSGGLTYAVKRFAGRCRPRAYVNGKCEDEHDAFPSGHTSSVAAMGGARLVTVLRGDPEDDNAGLRWAAFAIAESSIVVTGALRMGANAHSWEDVVGGAILGHAAGVLVAFLHPEEPLDYANAAARKSAMRSSSSSIRARAPRRGSASRDPGALPVPLAVGWGTTF